MSERVPVTSEKFEAPKAEHREHHPHREKESHTEKLKPEEARGDVAEAISQAEKASAATERTSQAPQDTAQHIISSKQKKAAYKHTMRDIQKDMSGSSRAFSKIIHQPAVENISEVVGKTVARPTSILFGSICAFVVMIAVYLLARHNGFRLSGSEFIVLFAVGWAVGLLADMLRVVIVRNR